MGVLKDFFGKECEAVVSAMECTGGDRGALKGLIGEVGVEVALLTLGG